MYWSQGSQYYMHLPQKWFTYREDSIHNLVSIHMTILLNHQATCFVKRKTNFSYQKRENIQFIPAFTHFISQLKLYSILAYNKTFDGANKGKDDHTQDDNAKKPKNDWFPRPRPDIFLGQVHLHWEVYNHGPKGNRSC